MNKTGFAVRDLAFKSSMRNGIVVLDLHSHPGTKIRPIRHLPTLRLEGFTDGELTKLARCSPGPPPPKRRAVLIKQRGLFKEKSSQKSNERPGQHSYLQRPDKWAHYIWCILDADSGPNIPDCYFSFQCVVAAKIIGMKTFNISADADLSGGVFPEDIESQNWIGFHGTSGAYSERIEAEGFTRTKPLPIDDIELVENLARCHPKAMADADSVSDFRQLGTLSFTTDTLFALSYTHPGTLGGQGVGYVLQAAEALLAAEIELAVPDRKRLEVIVARVREIRTRGPVVYAVDLQGLARHNYDSHTAGIYVHQWIRPDRILAKAVVDPGFDISSLSGSRQKVRALREKTGSWLSGLSTKRPNPRAWDIVDQKDGIYYTPWRITAEDGDSQRFVELTNESFAPANWETVDPEEKQLAEKNFFRELTDGFVQVMAKSDPAVANRMARECFDAFFHREPGELHLNAAPDDPELLSILQRLGQQQVLQTLAQKERDAMKHAIGGVFPVTGTSLRL